MSSWQLIPASKKLPVLRKPVLVEGMPGIGNVGKVAVDFVIEELGAEKLYDLFSHHLPSSVFVTEDNLVDLPSISLYFKKRKRGPDLLLLAGDVQPIDEESTYTFCEKALDVFQKFRGGEIVTLGGIGLPSVPKKPKLYCTGNMEAAFKPYTAYKDVSRKLYGVVGPIMGVSGLLLGMAKRRNIPAAALLAETYGHPMYLGIKGAREIVRVLNQHLKLDIDLKEMDSEISRLEDEISRKRKVFDAGKARGEGVDVNYIG